jgi:hypothetical protein
MPRVFAVGVAVAVGALLAAAVGSGASDAFRIVDRTLVCPMVGVGHPDSVRVLTVSARSYDVFYDYPPSANMSNGWAGGSSSPISVAVRTGPGPGPADNTGAVWLPRTRCERSSRRVKFSSARLKAALPDREHYRCDVPARVLIRIRAVFARPTAFSRDPRSPTFAVAKGQIAEASIAAATVRGRTPLAFASVNHSSGKARMFVSSSVCAPA